MQPKIVLVLGGPALKVFSGKTGVGSQRGAVFISKSFGVKCIATYHPSAVLRGNEEYGRCLRQDIKKASREASGDVVSEFKPMDVSWIWSLDDLSKLKRILLEQEAFSFDLETSGFKQARDGAHILIASFGWKGGTAILPLEHPDFDWEDDWDDAIELLEEIMGSSVVKIAHNGKFDVLWLRGVLGIDVNNFSCDTMLAHYAVSEYKGTHGLKQLAGIYLGIPDYTVADKLTSLPRKKRHKNTDGEGVYFGDLDLETLGRYAAIDAEATFRLWPILHKEMVKNKVDGMYRKVLVPASRVLTEVELNGVQVDLKYLDRLEKDLDDEMAEMAEELLDHKSFQVLKQEYEEEAEARGGKVKPKEIKFTAREIEQVLFSIEGLEPIKRTDSGKNWSTDKHVMAELSKTSDLVAAIWERKKVATLQNGYGRGLRKFLIGDKIYPSYLIHGTVTGRLSCSDPNFQQIPREARIKRLYIGHNPEAGDVILEADYSQMELRVITALSGDQNFKEIFRAGKDAHTAIAAKIYDVELDEVTKDQRSRAKTMNFAIMYGKGPHTLAGNLGISVPEAKAFIAEYFQAIPGVKTWIKNTKKRARTDGYVKTPFGRIRHLPEIHSSERSLVEGAYREAVNTPIQSAASDITLLAMVELYDVFKKKDLESCIVGVVHDSIVINVRKAEREELPGLVRGIMEGIKYSWINVPLVADVKMGRSWGEAKEVAR